jgi:hypothetical protein
MLLISAGPRLASRAVLRESSWRLGVPNGIGRVFHQRVGPAGGVSDLRPQVDSRLVTGANSKESGDLTVARHRKQTLYSLRSRSRRDALPRSAAKHSLFDMHRADVIPEPPDDRHGVHQGIERPDADCRRNVRREPLDVDGAEPGAVWIVGNPLRFSYPDSGFARAALAVHIRPDIRRDGIIHHPLVAEGREQSLKRVSSHSLSIARVRGSNRNRV